MGCCFIDQFDAILLDMGDTFMFGCDRFGEEMAETYRRIGGRALSASQVREILARLFEDMLALGRNQAHWECYPTIGQRLAVIPESRELPLEERSLLAHVFALHEVGTIPQTHALELHALGRWKRLGVISNIWSQSDTFLDAFDRAGVRGLMDVIVFSSDHGCIKPSARLFDLAAQTWAYDRSRLVFVGDKLHRDVAGAKAAGMAAVWINAAGTQVPADGPQPDRIIPSLLELRHLP